MDTQEIDIGQLRVRLREYKPSDGESITPAVRLSSEFRAEIQQLRSDGVSWAKIAQLLGGSVLPKTLSAAFERQENKRKQIERKRKAAERAATAAAKPSVTPARQQPNQPRRQPSLMTPSMTLKPDDEA